MSNEHPSSRWCYSWSQVCCSVYRSCPRCWGISKKGKMRKGGMHPVMNLKETKVPGTITKIVVDMISDEIQWNDIAPHIIIKIVPTLPDTPWTKKRFRAKYAVKFIVMPSKINRILLYKIPTIEKKILRAAWLRCINSRTRHWILLNNWLYLWPRYIRLFNIHSTIMAVGNVEKDALESKTAMRLFIKHVDTLDARGDLWGW